MKYLNYLILFTLAIFVISCGKDDDDDMTTKKTEAAFDIQAINEYVVTFKNNSKNATSYEWDFGDGNTSTTENPEHTYAENGTYTVKLTAKGDDSSEAKKDVTINVDLYRKDGYVISAVAGGSGGNTYYTGFYESLPQSADLTEKQAFQRMRALALKDGFIYSQATNNEPGIQKLAVDKKTNEIVIVDELPLFDFATSMTIVRDDLAFLGFFGAVKCTAFNPMTMEVIKDIDLSGAKTFPDHDNNGISGMAYNDVTGKLYLFDYANLAATPQFYDIDGTYVEVIDVATLTREKTIHHPNADYPLFRGTTSNVTDALGNTYMVTQGSYGIDGQVGATAKAGSRPQILKINANSEFDLDYAFNPISSLGLENNFFQLFTSMVIGEDGYAYGVGTARMDSPEVVALLQKLGAGTITQEEYDQLVALVLYDESMKFIKVDLSSGTASVVDDSPFVAGFAYPFMYNFDDKIYVATTSDGGTFNGIYEIDTATDAVTKKTNVTAGGLVTMFVDLSQEF